jgi:hypothetical protein
MTEEEKYLFDLNGYILVKRLLSASEVADCLRAAKELEPRVRRTIDKEPFCTAKFGLRYHLEEELGCSWYKSDAGGTQHIVEDFINASPSFDCLINHQPTMKYVHALARGPYHITSAELRFRYQGNYTPTHMGGPIDPRNRYEFIGRRSLEPITGAHDVVDFDLICVRVLYALHDMPIENGPLCVVPGSHKGNFFSPYGEDPRAEPGMVGIPMEAGDAIFFTENLRHGGFPNLMATPRITTHFVYNPVWVGSQSPAHWDDNMYVAPETLARYTVEQRALFPTVAPSPRGTMASSTAVTLATQTPSETKSNGNGASDSAALRELLTQLSQSQSDLRAAQDQVVAMQNSRTWRTAQRLRPLLSTVRRLKSTVGL